MTMFFIRILDTHLLYLKTVFTSWLEMIHVVGQSQEQA